MGGALPFGRFELCLAYAYSVAPALAVASFVGAAVHSGMRRLWSRLVAFFIGLATVGVVAFYRLGLAWVGRRMGPATPEPILDSRMLMVSLLAGLAILAACMIGRRSTD